MKQKQSLKKINNNSVNLLKEQYFISELHLIEKDSIILIMKLNEIDKLMENNGKLFDNLTSTLSMLLEEYLQDDFKRWNVYFIYITAEPVTKEIKYKVENDTFFARKIVEDNYLFQLSDENIKNIISEHIDFTDLKINVTQPIQEIYESNSEVYLKLKDKDSINEKQIDEILKSLEGISHEI
ncbi:ABC-three component system middle component 1 [Aliarcobacter butzleri]|uniref:ABC-three component system middle component 1 n=1 Tax=Aliarcobacter butzleri TaxID=28197 RepID=UPI001EDA181F|nr:ABC-three component system middle component 1 [Aliarcobacter butzleri]MCG3692499.1 hypothetical protein [Aliarcobacter butzleri]